MGSVRCGGGSLAVLLAVAALVAACGLETGGAERELDLGDDGGAGTGSPSSTGGGAGKDAAAPKHDSGSDSGHPPPDASAPDAHLTADSGDDAACAAPGCPCAGADSSTCFLANEVCLIGKCTACGAFGSDQLECQNGDTCFELIATCAAKPGD